MKVKTLGIKEFKDQVKEGREFGGDEVVKLRKSAVAEVQEIKDAPEDNNGLVLQFSVSTQAEDRDGDTIDPAGWKIDNYLKNPVVLWAHDGSTPPIARSLAIWVEDGKLKSRADFTPKELNPFGYMVYEMYKKRFMNATSVGFIPIKYVEAADRSGWYPMDFIEQELLEYSAVPIPSNPEALVEARIAGVDVEPMLNWAGKTLETWGKESGVWLKKKQVEDIWGMLKPDKHFSLPPQLDNQEMQEAARKLAEQMGIEPQKIIADNKEKDAIIKSERGDVIIPYSVLDGLQKGEEARGSIAISYKLFAELLEQKSGRVLSAANEAKISGACDDIGKALETLNSILEELPKEEGGEGKNGGSAKKENYAIMLSKGVDKLEEIISRFEALDSQGGSSGNDDFILELADGDPEPKHVFEVDEIKGLVRDALHGELKGIKMALTGRLD